MEKYLVFRLENRYNETPTMNGYVEPCFKLVKEFDPQWVNPLVSVGIEANEFARQYSVDNKIRTFVVKGTVFGD